jgi:hypothetical protein
LPPKVEFRGIVAFERGASDPRDLTTFYQFCAKIPRLGDGSNLSIPLFRPWP